MDSEALFEEWWSNYWNSFGGTANWKHPSPTFEDKPMLREAFLAGFAKASEPQEVYGINTIFFDGFE